MDYVTQIEVDTYVQTKLDSAPWDDSDLTDRGKAISESTRILSNLNWAGDKTVATQELEFPRGGDTQIPQNIKDACSEIVLALLDGVNPENEVNSQRVMAHGYSSVKTTYNPDLVSDHYMAGVPSYLAWQKLLPFLRDPGEVTLSRVS